MVCSGVLCKEELLGQVPFMSVSATVKNCRGESLSWCKFSYVLFPGQNDF